MFYRPDSVEHVLNPTMQFVVTGNDPKAARDVAAATGAMAYIDDRDGAGDLPFRTLVRAVTDRPGLLDAAAGIGRYIVVARPQRVRPSGAEPADADGIIQVNALIAARHLDHIGADTHWRDTHAPLALKHHVGMTQYTQLSVVHTISGPAYDGFALCEFDSLADFRERFFDGPEGREVILADIAKFADLERSPRRLVAHR